ncbi:MULTISPECIES: polysaccharide deacetylase family protein [unclassified Colwellia]|uniref:polysaccharide deacetylase family protein n=2 Tax=unclassified Colwellia TaxID=196834 RepID=UPI0015F71CDF|nr:MULTISPECIES: polysaccharide deacetylase family protein [unclassified Colwellia]MBA6301916.1 polysaccharide deacetylase family protein [Colwellia sp. MB02u-14]MBA6237531.1 polysaccharide deacetylase family protein [Colwellia sp. MB02u-11]MBA6256274.1 polysaccharide deacetylase family protein [Colwellia sp. MB3u-28]MBA6260158.1 polysaccharide deacetylase family protein [Colwellia sp. MB3u-41]MBA6300163.1 polysaccharide deacetylase family protein [Colwellia sp. MB3u-22]
MEIVSTFIAEKTLTQMIISIGSVKCFIKRIIFKVLVKGKFWKYFINSKSSAQTLMYHRISDNKMIPGISPYGFEKHLKFLTEYYNIVPIKEILLDRKNNTEDPYKIAITFDDGYYDFYHKAWPLLKKYKIPVSLYVTTDFIDRKEWLWPDKIRTLLLSTKINKITIPNIGELVLTIDNYSENWNVIADLCLNHKKVERDDFLQSLSVSLDVSIEKEPDKGFSALSWSQLKEMSNEGLDIGSHTLSHAILTKIDDEQLYRELYESKAKIENMLDINVEGICYPNGMHLDVSDKTVNVAEKVNYKYGLTAYTDKNETVNVFKVQRIAATESVADFAFNLLN